MGDSYTEWCSGGSGGGCVGHSHRVQEEKSRRQRAGSTYQEPLTPRSRKSAWSGWNTYMGWHINQIIGEILNFDMGNISLYFYLSVIISHSIAISNYLYLSVFLSLSIYLSQYFYLSVFLSLSISISQYSISQYFLLNRINMI